jgi:hypothetical protein
MQSSWKRGFGLALTAAIGLLLAFALWQARSASTARRWEHSLTTAKSFDDVRETIYDMVQSDTQAARDLLEKHSKDNPLAAYDPTHNVLMLIDSEAFLPHRFDPWGYTSERPDLVSQYQDVRIVENLPDAVIFAATIADTQRTSLFICGYKHRGVIHDLAPLETDDLIAKGVWKTYVRRHGDPVAKRQTKSWTKRDEREYANWLRPR